MCYKSESFDIIDDALKPLGLNERESKRLLRKLTCPQCESRVSTGTFVATLAPEQRQQARLARKFDLLYGNQMDFREFLIKYPMLGAEHSFGKMLSEAMRRAKTTTLEPQTWYRATSVDGFGTVGPRPSHETTRANRYNQIGQAAWYLGCDDKTAAVEMMRQPKIGEAVQLAKVRITEPISVLDFACSALG